MPLDLLPYIGSLLLGYLIGSSPNAVIATRLVAGQDIRKLGTRNAGAANVFREVGHGPGIIVGVADILKGIIPVLIVTRILELGPVEGTLAGIGALWGHQFSFVLSFRGGAGMATAMGAVGGLLLGPYVIAAGFGIVFIFATKNMGWSGGIVLVVTFLVGILSVWTSLDVLPDALAVTDPSYIYGGFTVAFLLLIPFLRRRLLELTRRREVFAPSANQTTEDREPPAS